MLWHLNSGSHRFQEAENLASIDDNKKKQLIHEIESEVLTDMERENLIEKYLHLQGRGGYCDKPYDEDNPQFGRDARILTCGACGVRNFQRGNTHYYQHFLQELDTLSFTEEQKHRYNAEKNEPPITVPNDDDNGVITIHLHKMRSVYESQDPTLRGAFFHLHPEFIYYDEETGKESTHLCESCHTTIQEEAFDSNGIPILPLNSIAAGVDFGDLHRVGISPPNPLELSIIAKVRHYHHLVKIQPNGGNGMRRGDHSHSRIRGHHILFPDDTAAVASFAVMLQHDYDEAALSISLADYITLQLVGPAGEMDFLAQETLGCTKIMARASKIYQYLAILQHRNQLYIQDPILPSLPLLHKLIQRVNNQVVESALRTTDKDSINAEHVLGDDVAQVRTTPHYHRHFQQETTENIPMDISPCQDNLAFAYSSISQKHASSALLNSSVTNTQEESNKEEVKNVLDLLKQAADAFDIDLTSGIRDFQAKRNKVPVNEFDGDDYALCAAFPHIFLYGSGYSCQLGRKNQYLNKKEIQHMLLQYTTLPATCRELIFYLFDKYQRHSVMIGMSAKVKSNPEAFAAYAQLLNSPEFEKKIQDAVREAPNGKTTKEVLSTIMPVLEFAGKQILFGAFEQTSSTSKLHAMTQRYTAGSTFFTISPNDISNPNSFRLSLRSSNNISFPSTSPEEYFAAMEKDASLKICGNVELPVDYGARSRATVSNPVSSVIEYQILIENMLSILIGIAPSFSPGTNSKTVRTSYFKDPNSTVHHKGVFGHILAFFGAHETQFRGALHFHIILYGGISPKLLECASEFQEFCDVISKVLDTMYTAQIPRDVHIQYLVNQEMKKIRVSTASKRPPGALLIPPSYKQSRGLWDMHAYENCMQTNIHFHSPTCYKPPSGSTGCRGAKPSGLKEKTMPVELEETNINKAEKRQKSMQVPSVKFNITPKQDPHKRNIDQEPVPLPDNRVIVWELKRPEIQPLPPIPTNNDAIMNDEERASTVKTFCISQLLTGLEQNGILSLSYISKVRDSLRDKLTATEVFSIYNKIQKDLPGRNGYITEFNDTITNLTGSSVNAIFLGNSIQARNAMYYLTTYVTKNKVQMGNCLTALNEASKHVKKYVSTAEDTGTKKRTTQHILSRVLNSMNRHMEVSDTQAVLALLNQGAPMCSDTFSYYAATAAVYYVTRLLYYNHMEKQGYLLENGLTVIEEEESNETDNNDDDDDDDGDDDDDDTMSDFIHDDTETRAARQSSLSQVPAEIDLSHLGKYSGKAKIYRLGDDDTGKKIPVDYNDHYRFRGAGLAKMSRQEYYALVGIKPKSKKIQEEEDCDNLNNKCNIQNDETGKQMKKKAGRKTSPLFEFAKGHLLHSSHVQYLKSKQTTLIFTGRRPIHPGLPPTIPEGLITSTSNAIKYGRLLQSWKKKADSFAMYYLVAFRPEEQVFTEEHTTFPSYDWLALCDWIKLLESQDTVISKLRLDALFNNVCAFSTKNKHRTMLSSYRMRNRTVWTRSQQQQAMDLYESTRNTIRTMAGSNELTDFLNDSTDLMLDSKTERFSLQEMGYIASQNESLDVLFGSQRTTLSEANNIDNHNDCNSIMDEDDMSSSSMVVHNIMLHVETPDQITAIVRSIKNIKTTEVYREMDEFQEITNPQQDGQTDIMNQNNSSSSSMDTIEEKLRQLNLSQDQKNVIDEVKIYLEQFVTAKRCSIDLPKPLRLLCTGGPGVGKSFIIHTITEMAEWFGAGRVVTTSYNGIAAVNVDGITLCSLLGFRSSDRSSQNVGNGTIEEIPDGAKLEEMRHLLDSGNLCFFIVDEASNIDSISVAAIDSRLKSVMMNNLDFGGIPILFVADFSQLSPVKAPSLPHSLMQLALLLEQEEKEKNQQLTSPFLSPIQPIATSIPGQIDNQELQEQHSTSDNELPSSLHNHNSSVPPSSKIRKCHYPITGRLIHRSKRKKKCPHTYGGTYSIGTSRRRGCDLFAGCKRFHMTSQQRASGDLKHTQFINKLSNGKSITMKDINHYQRLAKADIEQFPEQWKYAPILVASNRERINIIQRKAMLYAKDFDTHVIKWQCTTMNWRNKPTSDFREAEIVHSDPCFWEYFVPGGDAFLTYNVNNNLGLANGSPIKLHSLTFADHEQLSIVLNLIKVATPGSEIILSQPPLAVNILIPLPTSQISSKRKAQLRLLLSRSISQNGDEIIIPITQNPNKCKWQKYTIEGHNTFSVGRVETRPFFTYDLGFAMTVHKAQGRTISRVVLAFSRHPLQTSRMSYASIFVAMTRVRDSGHLRLLYHNNGCNKGQLGVEYITTLHPDPNVFDYYAGFCNDSGYWKPAQSLRFKRNRPVL